MLGGEKNDGDLIWKLVNSCRQKRDEKSVKADKSETHNLTKQSNMHASQRRGGKYAASATATPIPAPKKRNIGYNTPCPMMIGHSFNTFWDRN